jgi:endonuclease/exonuclease/phosphatase (EEP) superfamily protein YafD
VSQGRRFIPSVVLEGQAAPAVDAGADQGDLVAALVRRSDNVLRSGREGGKWLTRFAWTIAITPAALLALSYLLPQDLWATWTPYLYLCLIAFVVRLAQLPIGLGLLLLSGSAAIARRWKLAGAAAVIGLLAATPVLWETIPWRTSPVGELAALRLMSFNLNADNRDADAVDRQVRAADPDVVTFQEFTDIHRNLFRDTLETRYPYVGMFTPNAGVAVYSKIPLRVSGRSPFNGLESDGRCRYEIEFCGQTVALYAVHVPRFDSIDRLRQSRLELARVLAYVAADPLPVILAGDFNFTEQSPNAAAIRKLGFRSAHEQAGAGLAVTRPVELPVVGKRLGFRIDHVFLKPPLTATRFSVCGAAGSDHLPIVADIAWRPS